MKNIEIINILPLIKEVNEKYMPLRLNTKDREITEEESNQLFELSIKIELFKIIKTMFMEEITKNEKIIGFMIANDMITTHTEFAEKDGKEVTVTVVDQSMDERISMMPKEFALPIFEKLVKAHKENIEYYTNNGNEKLLKKEQYELDIINSFLPKEATKEDILAWLNKNCPNGVSMKEMGPTIGKVKKAFDRADGKMISEVVKSIAH